MSNDPSNQQGFNRQLASQIRPGDSIDDLKRVWGSRWSAPTRKDAGFLDAKKVAGVACLVRIDRTGLVGSVTFYGNFPAKYSIEGIALGMSLEELTAARSALKLGAVQDETSVRLGISEYAESLPNSCELTARVQRGRVIGISIVRAGADYPSATEFVPAPAGRYPPPSAQRGAPFADANLKLAVMHQLVQGKVIDLGTDEDLAMHVRQRYVNLSDEGYDMLTDVYDYLARYPLSADHLATVDRLRIDQTLDIYIRTWPLFDGQSDEFDVRSLEGIEQCPNITELVAWYVRTPVDLRPLKALQGLTSIEFFDCAPLKNGQVLLELPNLRKAWIPSGVIDDSIVAALRSKGVST